MQLRIVTPGPSNQLPEELLTHRVDHSVDVFHKKSRPYAKISVPPGYTENQALCQQFVSTIKTRFVLPPYSEQILTRGCGHLALGYFTALAPLHGTCSMATTDRRSGDFRSL
jgi:hypothetical protein